MDGRWGAVVDSGGSRPPGTDVVRLGTTGVGGAEMAPPGPRPPVEGGVGTAGSVATGAPPPSTVEVRVLVPPLPPGGGGAGVGAGQGTGTGTGPRSSVPFTAGPAGQPSAACRPSA